MTAVPGPAFRECLDALDDEAFAAFTAAAYEARGWDVERTDGGLRATPPRAERPRRLAIRDPEDDRDATDGVVDAAALHRLVAYGLAPADRTRLCREFLDRDPESFERRPADGTADADDDVTSADDDATSADDDRTSGDDSAGSGGTPGRASAAVEGDGDRNRERSATGDGDDPGDDGGTNGDGDAAGGRRRLVRRATAIGLVVAFAIGVGVAALGASDGVGAAAVLGGNGAGGDGTATNATGPNATGPNATATNATAYPPGVDETGITDASALADAHEAVLSNRSYRLRVTYREFADGELRGVAHERAVVASPDHYRSRVGRLGTVNHESQVVASGSMYANGTVGYVRTDEGVRQRREGRPAIGLQSAETVGFVDRTERIVRWYLSVDDSRIVGRTERDGTTTYRIAFADDPWRESRNVTGWARVDGSGLVRELHREYTPSSAPAVRIEVTVRVRPGPVTVTRPAWAPANATSANATARRRPTAPTRTEAAAVAGGE
ncbi:hypothetical protein [Haloplanus halophilus]|uniref:hypothetical protein n=1 Tax=Haloplanus halophilus TaxID=2949993 RepID=UPI00203D74C8|nr:hypothetical protein [Haloplanus sp. GDY1]